MIRRGIFLRTLRRQTLPQRPAAATRTLYTTTTHGALCFQCAGKLLARPRPRIPQILRGMATAAASATESVPTAMEDAGVADPAIGPLAQYDAWVREGRLRDDEYQRGIVKNLQSLHDRLTQYNPPKVIHPTIESLAPPPPQSFFNRLFGREHPPLPQTQIPENIPKGLYLYGDVGSGKTMLMDMFYNTLPSHITSKTRIHFHHFMQDVHKRLHKLKMRHGPDFDAIPFVGADLAQNASVLCFDEFQCTDVADAMILRRLLESLMSHGVVMVATSNRHPDELYKNGIQRESFIPCIELLKKDLEVINLDSPTDYRKIPRPPSGVYFHPANTPAAKEHAQKWFNYLSDPRDPPSPRVHQVWGREIKVPKASGRCAMFHFDELCGGAVHMSAADYIELTRNYRSFVVVGVPGMDHRSRDLARRLITFLDACYEEKSKLVLTMDVPIGQLFVSSDDIKASIDDKEGGELDAQYRSLMDDLGLDMKMLKNSSIFSGDEERFAFQRALSRLVEMGSVQWIEA